MRLWSVHPLHLDRKGLVALWREALLAKKVLEGKTKGYKNHPQLNRFKIYKDPIRLINQYLLVIHDEATKRGYHFDRKKINLDFKPIQLPVSKGQVEYEAAHLKQKLKNRDIDKYRSLCKQKELQVHPLFYVVDGKIEEWEKLK
jgi:hypothetical protein